MTPTVSGWKPGKTVALEAPNRVRDDLGEHAAVVGRDRYVGVQRRR